MESDRIEIRGLRVDGVHGVLPSEQRSSQPFEVDLDLHLDLSVAARSDELADSADYAAAVDAAARVVRGPSRRLLETLAEEIAGAVLADPHVAEVTVALRKLRPPVPEDIVSAGVRIHRRRS